jgi:hypothetical protein
VSGKKKKKKGITKIIIKFPPWPLRFEGLLGRTWRSPPNAPISMECCGVLYDNGGHAGATHGGILSFLPLFV